jgi:branched-chain amino acid transport system substrate-binding protein
MHMLTFVLFLALVQPTLAANVVSQDTIKIGQCVPLEGTTKSMGTFLHEGLKTYIKKTNDAGGINGRKIDLIAVNDNYDPKVTVECFDKLHDVDKVFAMASFYGAPSTAAVLPRIDKTGVPYIAPVSGMRLDNPMHKTVFALRPNTMIEGEALAKYIIESEKMKDIGVFFQDDAYGQTGLNGVTKGMSERKLEAPIKASYLRGSAEVAEALKVFLLKKPKAVIIAGIMPAAGAFVEAASKAGYSPKYFVVASVVTPEFRAIATKNNLEVFASQIIPSTSDVTDPFVKQYVDDMKAAELDPAPQFRMEGYLGGYILVQGLKSAGKDLTTASFLKAMESLKLDFGKFKIKYSPTEHQGFTSATIYKL